MKEPVDHIIRPLLPWRSDGGAITECGYNAASVRSLSRSEYAQRVKDLGKQRASMLTCMTCAQTSERWGTWEDDPLGALSREIEWERGAYYRQRGDRGTRLKDEMEAITSLIEAHRDEFDALVSQIEQRRDWQSKKDALKNRGAAKPRPRNM